MPLAMWRIWVLEKNHQQPNTTPSLLKSPTNDIPCRCPFSDIAHFALVSFRRVFIRAHRTVPIALIEDFWLPFGPAKQTTTTTAVIMQTTAKNITTLQRNLWGQQTNAYDIAPLRQNLGTNTAKPGKIKTKQLVYRCNSSNPTVLSSASPP